MSKTIYGYNIASRATQSNLAYVSVLQISIVHSRADGVSKSLCQNFFFSHEQPLLAPGKILYFGTIKYTNRDSAHLFQNEDNFPTFSLGLELLKERKTTEKGDSASEPSRFASLSEKCNKFWQKDTLVKPNKRQNWSVSTLKGKRKFFRFEIVKFKTRAFNKKIEIKPIPIVLNSLTANNHFWYCRPFFASDLMHNSTGYVIKQLVHAFSCALSSYGALRKFGEHSRSFFRALQTSRVLHLTNSKR